MNISERAALVLFYTLIFFTIFHTYFSSNLICPTNGSFNQLSYLELAAIVDSILVIIFAIFEKLKRPSKLSRFFIYLTMLSGLVTLNKIYIKQTAMCEGTKNFSGLNIFSQNMIFYALISSIFFLKIEYKKLLSIILIFLLNLLLDVLFGSIWSSNDGYASGLFPASLCTNILLLLSWIHSLVVANFSKTCNLNIETQLRLSLQNLPVGLLIFRGRNMEFYNRHINDILGVDLKETDDEKLMKALFSTFLCEEQNDRSFEKANIYGSGEILKNIKGGLNASGQRLSKIDEFFSKGNKIDRENKNSKKHLGDRFEEFLMNEINFSKPQDVFKIRIKQKNFADDEKNSMTSSSKKKLGFSSNAIGSGSDRMFEKYRYFQVIFTRFAAGSPKGIKGRSEEVLILISLIDITEIMKSKVEEEQRNFKYRMLTGFSHELKTPLNGTISLIDCAIEDGDVNVDCKTKYLVQPQLSLKILKYLISDIIDYLKFENKQMFLQINRFKLASNMQEIYNIAELKARDKGLELKLFMNNLPEYFVSDADRFKRLLLNLLLNCVKYTFSGGIDMILTYLPSQDLQIVLKDTRFLKKYDLNLDFKSNSDKLLSISQLDQIVEDNLNGILPEEDKELGLYMCKKFASFLGPPKNSGIELSLNETLGITYTILIKDYKKMPDKKESDNSLGLSSSLSVPDEKRDNSKKIYNTTIKRNSSFAKFSKIQSLNIDENALSMKRKKPANEDFSFHNRRVDYSFKSSSHLSDIDSLEGESGLQKGLMILKENMLSNKNLLIKSISNNIAKASILKEQSNILVQDYSRPCECPMAMIVDDDSFNLYSLKVMFQKKNIKCITAMNGTQCLKSLLEVYAGRKQSPSKCTCDLIKLILMDLNMPVMDGFEASKKIKSLIDAGDIPFIPVIACSANDSEEDLYRCSESFMSGFLAKPVTMGLLEKILLEFVKY